MQFTLIAMVAVLMLLYHEALQRQVRHGQAMSHRHEGAAAIATVFAKAGHLYCVIDHVARLLSTTTAHAR